MRHAKEPEEREMLRILLMELTEGGEGPWVRQISEALHAKVRELAKSAS